MDITLRKINYNARMSEETLCFTADMYVNGTLTAHAVSRGTGGATIFHPVNRELLAQAEAYCESLPDICVPGFEQPLPMNLEGYVNDLVCHVLAEKDLKAILRTKILFQKPDKEFYTIRLKAGEKLSKEFMELFADRNPTYKVLNLMPFDEALKLYANPDAVENSSTAFVYA